MESRRKVRGRDEEQHRVIKRQIGTQEMLQEKRRVAEWAMQSGGRVVQSNYITNQDMIE